MAQEKKRRRCFGPNKKRALKLRGLMSSRKIHIKLYADEMFPITSVSYLKSKGYSVIHASDKKFLHKSDQQHLKLSKKLNMVLITLDRDFIYYDKVNLAKHPGVIVLSVSTATPPNINKLCSKLLSNLTDDFVKDSLLRVTTTKIIKTKNGRRTEKYF